MRSTPGVKQRYATGVLWAAAAAVMTQGGIYACAIIGARILGRETYGQLAAIQNIAIACANISTVGLGVTATKYVSEFRQTDTEKVGRILGLCFMITVITGTVLAASVMLSADVIASRMFGNPPLAPSVRASTLYVLFFAMNAYQIGTLMGLEAFRNLALAALIQSTAASALTLALTWRFGLIGAAGALSASAACSWVIHQIILLRVCRAFSIRRRLDGAWEERALLTSFALPAVLAGILGSSVLWVSSVLLVRQVHGFAEMAMYNAANMLRNLVLYLPGLGAKVAAPILSNLRGLRNADTYVRVWSGNLMASALAATLTAGVLAAGAPALLKVFGRDFTGGQTVALILLLSGIVEVLCVGFYQVILSCGRMWWQTGVVTIWAASWLLLTLVLIPRFGAAGLAGCSLSAWLLSLVFYVVLARKLLASKDAAPMSPEVLKTRAV